MGAIGISDYVAHAEAGAEVERRELNWLLTSGVLGRSGNLARVLKYVCEERFAGRASQIKEYSIATEALGRRPDFDPHTDTIVRVTVHSLRKRLLEVYQNEGADRPTRLILPPGHYDPLFVVAPQLEPQGALTPGLEEVQLSRNGDTGSVALGTVDAPWPHQPSSERTQLWSVVAIALFLIVAAATVWLVRGLQAKGLHALEDWLSTTGVHNIQAVNQAIAATAKPWQAKAGVATA